MSFFAPELNYFIFRQCTAEWCIREEPIAFHNLMFIKSGGCYVYINHKEYLLTAGDVIYVPYGAVRSAKNPSPDTQIYAFDFQLTGIIQLPISPVTHFDTFDTFEHYFSQINYCWYQREDGFELKCMGYFSIILYNLIYSPKTLYNPYVSAVKQYIVDHFNETLTCRELSKIVGLNPAYFGSLFRKIEGCTVQEYMHRIRINKAKDFLLSDISNISDIAYESGYNDVFYFSRMFKKLTGISPSQYRKEHRDH